MPAASAAAVGAAFALVAMLTPRTTPCSAFGAASWTCFASVVALAAAVVAAVLGSRISAAVAAADGAAGGSPNAIKPGSLGFAIAAAVAAVAAAVTLVLEYLAIEAGEPDSRPRQQRVQQASAWQTLASVTSDLQDSLDTKSLSIDCLRDFQIYEQVFKVHWESEGSELWRRMCVRVQPHKDPLTISLGLEDIKPVLRDFATPAVSLDRIFQILDADKDGKITEQDAIALVTACHKSNLYMVLTLADMLAIINSMEGGLHVIFQIMFGVLYLAVFDFGTQCWSGTGALLLIGFVWTCGNLFRHTTAAASWLLFARPYAVGDVIHCLNGEWRVLRIGLSTTTVQSLATGVPHCAPNSELAKSLSIANPTCCDMATAFVKVSIVGMPAGRLDEFIELLKAAAASHAAAHPLFYEAGTVGVQIEGDRLVCNGSTDFVEAELVVHWNSRCPASSTQQLQQAKARMLKVVRQQYSLFMEPAEATPPATGMRSWQSNPVYRSAEF
eukprot:GHUV01010547.1.p1 GENE.GHUV01010547.1~~GHUV01010547.1.p1  ORF type:complete len:508 (+),score=138.36 GHUV01010547.1:28-1524(+)